MAKNDDQNRAVGSSIGAIIAFKGFDSELFLLEVSGPMQKEDYNHFLKDCKELEVYFRKYLETKACKKLDSNKDERIFRFYLSQVFYNF